MTAKRKPTKRKPAKRKPPKRKPPQYEVDLVAKRRRAASTKPTQRKSTKPTKPTKRKPPQFDVDVTTSRRRPARGRPPSKSTKRRRPAQPKPVKRPVKKRLTRYERALKLAREQERIARREEKAWWRAYDRQRQREAEAERAAERAAEAEQAALIREQEAAARAYERELAREQRRIERVGRWFDREAAREAERERKRKEREQRAARAAQVREWEVYLDTARKERGKTVTERRAERKRERQVRAQAVEKTAEEYIVECLTEARECLEGLGHNVSIPQFSRLSDGTIDAELLVSLPPGSDPTEGKATLLHLSPCIKPVYGAWVALGFRFYGSDKIDYRIEKAQAGGKELPPSLRNFEGGYYTNLTNYRPAGAGEIADHVDATSDWLENFAEVNQAMVAQLFVRYYYSPSGRVPK